MSSDIQALFGLKHNPFSRGIPRDALWQPPGSEAFLMRLESIVADGGFALITGEPGVGKSKVLQLLAERVMRLGGDLVVGVMERPQGSVSDFYRELGALFGVTLNPANRYGGFKTLRERWRGHIQATRLRPVLLIDEAQEVSERCLTELQLLGSARFDSESLLTVVLCGDRRLPERFRTQQLAALGTRIRTRWLLEPWDRHALRDFLDHALDAAGAPHLMTEGLRETLVEHAGGNLRVLCAMGDELVHHGAVKKVAQLDEQLYVELFGRARSSTGPRNVRREA